MQLRLPEAERRRLGERLMLELDVVRAQLEEIKPRLQRHLKLYYADPESSWSNRVDGLSAYGVSLWRGKCDRVMNDTVGGLLSVEPYVQAIDEGGAIGIGESIERDLTFLADKAGLPEAFARSTFMSANSNLGAARVRPVVEKGRVVRLEAEWFDTRHFFAYPPNVERLEDTKTHGHRFYMRLGEVRDRQQKRTWFPGPVTGGADPDRETRLDGLFDQSVGPAEVDADDGFVELYELITEREDGERVFITMAGETGTVLDAQPWPDEYGFSWYAVERLIRTEKRLYGFDSVAGGVQGLCVMYADLMNATVGGFYNSAYPIIVREGFVGPTTTNYLPGAILDVPTGTKVYSVPVQFDFQKALALLDKIEITVDQTIGVSRLATSGQMAPNTTATAINAVMAADQTRQAGYQDAAAEALELLMGVILRLYQAHQIDLRRAYPDALTTPEEALTRPVRLIAAGRSAGDPKALLQKLMAFLEVASNPASPYDTTKVIQRVAAAFDLPFDPGGLEKDEDSALRQAAVAMRQHGIEPLEILRQFAQGELIPQGGAIETGTGGGNGPGAGMAAPAPGAAPAALGAAGGDVSGGQLGVGTPNPGPPA